MNPIDEHRLDVTSATFLNSTGRSVSGRHMSLLSPKLRGPSSAAKNGPPAAPGDPGSTHFQVAPYGHLPVRCAPSQMDTLDYKPSLEKFRAELPASIRMGQRLTRMTGPRIVPGCSFVPFRQYGKSGQWIRPVAAPRGKIGVTCALINSMYTGRSTTT
jgi:hypothetical protein